MRSFQGLMLLCKARGIDAVSRCRSLGVLWNSRVLTRLLVNPFSRLHAAHAYDIRANSSRKAMVVVASGGGKVDINKQGLNAIDDPTVQQNLMGRSRFMGKKDWKDASGRQGKVGCSRIEFVFRA
jgi:hypothetical protein